MGEGYHLHRFTIHGTEYGTSDPEYDMYIEDEKTMKLKDLDFAEKNEFHYEYDFGDGWNHIITVEKILPFDNNAKYPCCIKGKLKCPPEDCGGVWGYYEFLDAIEDENHPEHEETLRWIGKEFNPEEFDLEVVNTMLELIK